MTGPVTVVIINWLITAPSVTMLSHL